MKTLTTQQIEELKKLEWVEALNGENNNYFMSLNLTDNAFLDLTGIDLNSLYDNIYLPVSNRIEYYKSGVYKNGEKFYLQYIIFVDGVEWARGNFAMFVSDELGLFTPKTEEQEEQTEEQLFLDTIAGFIGEHDDEYIIDLLKQNCTDFWNKIVCDVVENLTADDIKNYNSSLFDDIKDNIFEDVLPSELPDSLFNDVVDDYLNNNPNDCFDKVKYDVDDDTIKDFVKDYINDNL